MSSYADDEMLFNTDIFTVKGAFEERERLGEGISFLYSGRRLHEIRYEARYQALQQLSSKQSKQQDVRERHAEMHKSSSAHVMWYLNIRGNRCQALKAKDKDELAFLATGRNASEY